MDGHWVKDSQWSLYLGCWDHTAIQISFPTPFLSLESLQSEILSNTLFKKWKSSQRKEQIVCPEWLMAFQRWASVENTWLLVMWVLPARWCLTPQPIPPAHPSALCWASPHAWHPFHPWPPFPPQPQSLPSRRRDEVKLRDGVRLSVLHITW